MEAQATAKYLEISPRKVRLEADLIRGQRANDALTVLKYSNRKASHFLEKVVRSALANAENKENFEDAEGLVVKIITVDSNQTMKRIRPRAMGRAYRIRKRTSTIQVILDDSMKPVK